MDNRKDGNKQEQRKDGASPLPPQAARLEVKGKTVEELLREGEALQNNFQDEQAMALYARAVKIDPNNAELWSRIATICEEDEEFGDALKYYLLAVKLDPENAKIWSKLGNYYDGRKMFVEAREAYEKALKITPDDGPIFFRLGIVYQALEMYEQGLELLNKAISKDPDYKLITGRFRGNCLLRLGRYTEAIDVLKEHLVERGDDDDSAWGYLGDAYQNLKQDINALGAYRKALEIDAHNGYVWYSLGCLLHMRGERKKARTAITFAARYEITKPLYLYDLGIMYAEKKMYKEAALALGSCFFLDKKYREKFDSAIKLHEALRAVIPELKIEDRTTQLQEELDKARDAKEMLGGIMTDFSEALELAKKGRYAEAEKFIVEWLDDTPAHLCGWNILGHVHFNLENYEECIRCKDKFIFFSAHIASPSLRGLPFAERESGLLKLKKGTRDAELADVYITKTKAFANLGREPEAEIAIEKAIIVDPRNSEAWAWKADLSACRKKYDECLAAADRALTYNPHSGAAMYYKGKALLNMNKHKEAFLWFEKCMLVTPDDPVTWFYCAVCQYMVNNPRKALQYISRALELCPTFKDAWHMKHLCHKALGEVKEAGKSLYQWSQVPPGAPHGKTVTTILEKDGKQLLQ